MCLPGVEHNTDFSATGISDMNIELIEWGSCTIFRRGCRFFLGKRVG